MPTSDPDKLEIARDKLKEPTDRRGDRPESDDPSRAAAVRVRRDRRNVRARACVRSRRRREMDAVTCQMLFKGFRI